MTHHRLSPEQSHDAAKIGAAACCCPTTLREPCALT